MNAIVVDSLAKALALRAADDTAQGYPKVARNVGGGRHAPPARTATVHGAAVLGHPTLAQWAYTDTTAGGRVALPNGAATQALDATWDASTREPE